MFAIAKLSLPEAHVTISGRSNSSILKQKEHTANFPTFYLAQYCKFKSNESSNDAFVLLLPAYPSHRVHKCFSILANRITIPHCLKLKKAFAIF